MKEVPQDFINAILEENNIGFNTSEVDSQYSKLKSATGGKHTAAPKGGNASEPTVPGEQECASKAEDAGPSNDTFSHEAEKVSHEGSPETPDVTVDYKKLKKAKKEKDSIVESLTYAIELLEAAISESTDDPEFATLKKAYPKKPGEDGVAYVTRLNTHRVAGAPKPAPSLQPKGAGKKAPKKTPSQKKSDAKTEKLLDKVTKNVKPASEEDSSEAAKGHGDK